MVPAIASPVIKSQSDRDVSFSRMPAGGAEIGKKSCLLCFVLQNDSLLVIDKCFPKLHKMFDIEL